MTVITREQLREYADASTDKNPIHLDDKFARDAGFPSVIAHGMLSAAYLADYLRMSFPEATYRLTRFRAKFRKVTFPGDRLTGSGEVKKVGPVLSVAVRLTNQAGEVTTDADAELQAL